MIDLNDEIAQQYLAGCGEHLAAIETDLLHIETSGAEVDEERVNRLFRGLHSIKGGAAFFELTKIRELAHRMEDVLALVRSRKLVPTSARIRVLLVATDRLHELIQNPGESNGADIAGIMSILARLPADERAPAEDRVAAPAGQAQQDARLRMLLVEDDFTCRLLLQSFLSRYGECQIAVNGREAVEAFRCTLEQGQKYDLICMDILMAEMDGREAVRRMRSMEQARGILSSAGVKIIMTTKVEEIQEVTRCFWELCDAYLIKPIDLNRLLRHMRSMQLVP